MHIFNILKKKSRFCYYYYATNTGIKQKGTHVGQLISEAFKLCIQTKIMTEKKIFAEFLALMGCFKQKMKKELDHFTSPLLDKL